MVKMLSMKAPEMSNGMMTVIDLDRRRLRAAKRALRRMDDFGLQEELEAFARRLGRRYGWRLGPPVHENVTRPTEVPDSFRQRIAEDNRLDMELYEYGRRLRRGRPGGPSRDWVRGRPPRDRPTRANRSRSRHGLRTGRPLL